MNWIAALIGVWFTVPAAVADAAARRPCAPYRFALGLFLLLLVAAASPRADGAERVSDGAAMYRRMVEAAVSDYWGAEGSSARLAAQLHQESLWRPKARSVSGAMGLAQFMPATAQWVAEQFPRDLGQFDPWDPAQAIRGAALYDRWLWQRVDGASACDRWAFTLSAYNGGLRWVQRDQITARNAGADPALWFDGVAAHADSRRARANVRQNRDYVARILTVLEPLYIEAGWSGVAVCP